MSLPLPKPKALLADKGYDGDRFRENLLMRGILPIIPPRSNRKVPVHPDYRRYKDRNMSSACSASLSSNAASPLAMTRQFCRSRAYSSSPHHVSG